MNIIASNIFMSTLEIVMFTNAIRILVRASIVKRTLTDHTGGFMIPHGQGLRYIHENMHRIDRFSWRRFGWHGIYMISFVPMCLVIIYLALLGELLYWIWFM